MSSAVRLAVLANPDMGTQVAPPAPDLFTRGGLDAPDLRGASMVGLGKLCWHSALTHTNLLPDYAHTHCVLL